MGRIPIPNFTPNTTDKAALVPDGELFWEENPSAHQLRTVTAPLGEQRRADAADAAQIKDANSNFNICSLKNAHPDQVNEIICHVNEVPHEE